MKRRDEVVLAPVGRPVLTISGGPRSWRRLLKQQSIPRANPANSLCACTQDPDIAASRSWRALCYPVVPVQTVQVSRAVVINLKHFECSRVLLGCCGDALWCSYDRT